jgi:acetoin utilization deacetylase AcuC-like enzyme
VIVITQTSHWWHRASNFVAMLVIHHPDTLLHETVELLGARLVPAYESPARIEEILKALSSGGDKHTIVDYADHTKIPNCISPHQKPASPELVDTLLAATHDKGYLEHLRTVHETWVAQGLVEKDECVLPECFRPPSFATGSRNEQPPSDIYARTGYYAFDMSSGMSQGSWRSINASATLAIEAGRLSTLSEHDSLQLPNACKHNSVLALCRPPGHHCNGKLAGGYCYVNNAVVAIESFRHYTALRSGFASSKPNVAVLDIDFHHGNGTQDYFYSDPSVLYASIHGLNEFPYYSGFPEETGQGEGEGYNVNFPIPVQSSAQDYLAVLHKAVQKIKDFKPDLLLVSLGFDTFRLDPLGSFDLDTADYEDIAAAIREPGALGNVPGIILLEGGYVLPKLGENMLSFLKGWEGGDKTGKI